MNIFKSNWSRWEDISTGSAISVKYILQARRHKNGRVEMRVSKVEATGGMTHPTLEQLGKITFKENNQ